MKMMRIGSPPRLGTLAFVCILALCTFGFFALDAGSKVPVGFDADGWTAYRKRNVALLLYAGAGLLAWLVGRATSVPWLRTLLLALLVLITVVLIAALSSANLSLRNH